MPRSEFDESPRDARRRRRHTQRSFWYHVRRFVVWAVVLGGGWFVLSNAYLPSWLDPKAPAAYDAWAVEICLRNDAIDDEARTLMPHRRVKYDPEFLAKTAYLVEQKQALLAEVRAERPVLWRRGLHRTLDVMLQNSIRHHAGRRAQFLYTQDRVGALADAGRIRAEDFGVTWDLMAQDYPDPGSHLQVGDSYQVLHDEVRAKLGLEPTGVWPQPTP